MLPHHALLPLEAGLLALDDVALVELHLQQPDHGEQGDEDRPREAGVVGVVQVAA